MNKYYNFAFAIVLFIVIEIPAGTSIQCYKCQSEVDADCLLDEPGERHLVNCSSIRREGQKPEYTACRKIDNNVDFEVLGQKPTRRVIRQCAADVDRERPCYYRAGFGGRANVCDCFHDKCNTAAPLVGSLLTMAIVAIAALLL